MESQLRKQFSEQHIEFNTTSKVDDLVIEKAATICRRFALSAEDLVYKWMSHQMNAHLDSNVPTLAALDDLQRILERHEKKSKEKYTHKVSPARSSYTKDDVDAVFEDDFMSAFGVEGVKTPASSSSQGPDSSQTFVTPARKRKARSRGGNAPPALSPLSDSQQTSPQQTPGTSNHDYSSRQNAGKQELVHNPQKRSTNTANLRHPQELDFGVYPSSVEKPYRYMFQKIRDIADVIDSRIDELGDRIVKKHKLLVTTNKDGTEQEGELAHVGMPNQEPVVAVGRVCLDTGAGKLNAASIELEGSRETSNGSRVNLNLADVPDFTMFPGQIIATQGTNTGGTIFTPSAIYQGAPLPMARTAPAQLLEHYFGESDQGTQVVDFIIAAGPFTTTKDMDYEPLEDLIDVIKKEKPDAVFLLGPFLDQTHPMVKNCELENTYEKEFERIIHTIAAAVIEETEHTELILVPSMRDVHHDNIFPQPPFQLPADMEHERLRCVSNPATVMIKEMTIGITTTDIIMDLSKQETSKGQSGDRMGRLANHLLEQRSYYPLCPPAPGVNLEYEKTDNLRLPITPDILIVPSDLRYFVKNVNNCVMINPGRLVKHTSGGTFAKMSVHAPRRNDIPEDTKPIPHGIHERAVVEILRV
eukprot:m.210390 g.210390  ORF g.210390 m.210390 type:complete len:643 (-) comp33075_c0_seq1:298-2226(-)